MVNTNTQDASGRDKAVFVDEQFIHTMSDDLKNPLATSFVGEDAPSENQAPKSQATNQVEKPAPAPGIFGDSPFAQNPQQKISPERSLPTNNPFQKAASSEKTFLPEQKTFSLAQDSGAQAPPANTAVAADSLEKAAPLVQKKEVPIIPASELAEKKANWFAISVSILVLLIMITGGIGGYYVWLNKNNSVSQKTNESPSTAISQEIALPEEKPVAREETVQITPTVEKFSSETPNILAFNAEQVTAEEIKTRLEKTLTEIRDSGLQKPVAFIINDQNNNPLAFVRFVNLIKSTLPAALLNNLEENFTLYAFNDSDGPRWGIAIETKNRDLAFSEMLKTEKTIVTDLAFLFSNEKPLVSTGTFRDGKYAELAVRYLNLNQQGTLSLDYTIKEKYLVFATSKNTLRAILDQLQN